MRLALALTASMMTIAGCEEERVVEKPVVRPVKMMTVAGVKASDRLEYPGTVKALQHADMAFEVPGRIIEFRFKEGQRVKKRDILTRLDPRDYKAQLDAEVARVRQSKAEYERYQALYEARSVSLSELQVRRRQYDVARSKERQARKALQDTVLRAPFAGIFAAKLVEDFENVEAKQPVLTLQDMSSFKIVVNVPEADMIGERDLRGQHVDEINRRVKLAVTLTSLPGRSFPAKVREYQSTADPVTRTFEVTLVMGHPPDVSMFPGMTTKVSAEYVAEAAPTGFTMIPSNAVLADETGASFVWLVDPSAMTVHKRPVVVGQLSGAQVEVREGLTEGDQIAVSGVRNLREGMQVRRLEEFRR